jgi:hypothetical protein
MIVGILLVLLMGACLSAAFCSASSSVSNLERT